MSQKSRRSISILGTAVWVVTLGAICDAQQLNQNCVVSILNRNIQVNPDGSWLLPNIPAGFGNVRARATCVNNGITTFGQSKGFNITANKLNGIPPITIGSTTPIPTSLSITGNPTTLNTAGATAQLTVIANYANGNPQDVTTSSTGTTYQTTNSSIATVSTEGLVAAVQSGTVYVQARNEGSQGIIAIQVVLGKSNGGIPDSWALAHGLDPNDPTMPQQDPDHDGLTNLQEFQLGTDPHNPDTDGDGLTDGQEVNIYHTNPLIADTDGDGIPDGLEVQLGTDPLNPNSFDYARALSNIVMNPASFVLNVNSIQQTPSVQLQVTGTFIGNYGTVDVTSHLRGTQYSSSDLTTCNFGGADGQVFAGNAGGCTITATIGGHQATSIGLVRNFSPTVLSEIPIPGFTNGIDVAGNYAYIASGPTGLQVVNIQNRNAPVIVGSVGTPGNGEDVKVAGNYAYEADGTSGLQVIDISNPASPVIVAAIATPGDARSLVVRGGRAYVAAATGGLQIIDVSIPLHPALLGSYNPGGQITVKGVDVDLQRNLAVLVCGSQLIVLNIIDPTHPQVLATNSQGLNDARNLALKGNAAVIADIGTGMTTYDLSNPASPTFLANVDLTLGGRLNDVVVSGTLALGADVYFPNGVPIVDISIPSQPEPRFILNFYQVYGAGFDDDGHGIAVDNQYLYLVAVNGTAFVDKGNYNASSHLYIGQYQSPVDNFGIPPIATIVSPTSGNTVILGSTLHVSVNATDDVAVAGVTLFVNGQAVSTINSAGPYEFAYVVPTNAPASLTLVAQATDFGGNVGTSNMVVLSTIPDPLTTAEGSVMDQHGNPVLGATVLCSGIAGQTGTNGAFSIPDIPTISGAIACKASAVVGGVSLAGVSASSTPLPGGTTNVGTITVTSCGGVLYENGPVNGSVEAWTINYGYVVSDSFVPNGSNFTGFDFYTWELPGSTLNAVQWSISDFQLGTGTVYGSGVAPVTDSYLFTNGWGYSVHKVSVSGLNVTLTSGNTYYLSLQNASANNGYPVYWDQNSGVGCLSAGCPSRAFESAVVGIPSEAFDVTCH